MLYSSLENLSLIKRKYDELFKVKPIYVRSPGRINLIGEHTDYNEGFVFPAAIDKEIIFAVAKNNENKFRFYANDFDSYFELEIEKLSKSKTVWANYLLGVVAEFKKENYNIQGIDCVFGGNIPIGAGLSSSAALENGFAFALNELYNLNIEKQKLIKMAQLAEHNYAGVKCGIMDQFTSMFGKANHAVMLDCRNLEFEYISLDLSEYSIILIDTKVSHNLASSEYNTRRNQCETGVKIIKKHEPQIKSLRDVSLEMINKYKRHLDPIVYKRCKYVIEENNRVVKANLALKNMDILKFGMLIYESHEGLSNEYEVSCKELDLLVDLAKKSNNVIGARMMGGGFGGCTINFVKNENVNDFIEISKSDYKRITGIDAEVYKVKISDGTSLIEI